MTMQADNPRAVPGSNLAPDYAQEVTARMRRDYEEVTNTVEALVEEAMISRQRSRTTRRRAGSHILSSDFATSSRD